MTSRRSLPDGLDSLPPILTAAETADLLRTSVHAVYSMHARGELPGAFRRGRRLLVLRSKLVQWIRASCASSPHHDERSDDQ